MELGIARVRVKGELRRIGFREEIREIKTYAKEREDQDWISKVK